MTFPNDTAPETFSIPPLTSTATLGLEADAPAVTLLIVRLLIVLSTKLAALIVWGLAPINSTIPEVASIPFWLLIFPANFKTPVAVSETTAPAKTVKLLTETEPLITG